MDRLLNHGAFKFGEGPADLKDQPAGRRRGVDVLLIQIQIDADRFQMLDRSQQVQEAAPNAVSGPGHNDVELPPAGVVQHPVEAGTVLSPFDC